MLKYASILLALTAVGTAQQPIWAQCGGLGYTGPTTCVDGSVCTVANTYYSQCIPGPAPPLSTDTYSSISASPSASTSTRSTSLSASPGQPTPSGSLPKLGGVNTAGFDFTLSTDGGFRGPPVTPPLSQYSHFWHEGVNLFRIPFAWQSMTPTLGAVVNSTFLARYDQNVQAAMNSGPGVYVIIDLHNYARWNGRVVGQAGQSGPTNAQFNSLWQQVARKYASNSHIIFGLMNAPHDLPSLPAWVDTVQQAVNAIRQVGAQNYILLPGSSWSSVSAFPQEAGPLLLNVTDPIGGTSKLIFDVQKYLDSDNSGTHPDCVTDNTAALRALVAFLQQNGNRQAILTQTGGGNTASCEQLLGNELAYVKSAYPTLVGFSVWAAGAFTSTYPLSVSPDGDQDQPLWTQAIQPNLPPF